MNKMTIFFDMDGTLADFYGVENWLDHLEQSNAYPYAVAKPMFSFALFARYLHRLQSCGYRIGIISLLSKTGTEEFNAEVTEVKLAWLAKHLPSVVWDEIHIIPYTEPKATYCRTPLDILFDDEERNRNAWGGRAFDEENILTILRNLS